MKSVTFRNLVGGFLGGALGILSSWYVTPVALPLGVLIGVVLGWWHEDVLRVFRDAARQAREKATSLVGMADQVTASLARLCGLSTQIAGAVRWTVRAITNGVVWTIRAPKQMIMGISKHSDNQRVAIDVSIFLLLLAGLPTLCFFVFEPMVGFTEKGDRGVLATLAFLVVTIAVAMSALRHDIGPNPEGRLISHYFRGWEIQSHYGNIGYICYSFWQLMRLTLGTTLFLTVMVPWVLFAALAIFLFIGPLGAMAAVVCGLCRIVNRAGHWLCFGTTVTTTGVLWILYRQSFTDPRVLWTVALGAGILSGAITEAVRRAILPFLANNAIGQKLIEPHIVGNLVFGSEKFNGFVDSYINRVVFVWFAKYPRPARLLRAFCFGLPLTPTVDVPQH